MFCLVVCNNKQEMQTSGTAKEFIGAAMLPDIVHHAFNGISSAFLKKARPVR